MSFLICLKCQLNEKYLFMDYLYRLITNEYSSKEKCERQFFSQNERGAETLENERGIDSLGECEET